MLLQGSTVNGQRATTGGTHEDTVIISTGERSCCRARGQRQHALAAYAHFASHRRHAWDHGLEQSGVDRFLREANIELTRPPVRDIDKSVKVFLQHFARIGFQVSPFVVVREARGGDCGPRLKRNGVLPSLFSSAESQLRGNRSTGIRSPGPSAPVAIRDNPFHACWCRRRQRQLQDWDLLPRFASMANGNNLASSVMSTFSIPGPQPCDS